MIMLSAGFCKPRDIRLLASGGRLTDQFLNTVSVQGDCKDTDSYLLPTFVVRLIEEGRFEDLDRWTTRIPKQSKPWVFCLHESNHWMAVRTDGTGRLIKHYDPMSQKLTGRSRRILQVRVAAGSARRRTNSPFSMLKDGPNIVAVNKQVGAQSSSLDPSRRRTTLSTAGCM